MSFKKEKVDLNHINIRTIIISRTDAIGDVVLTLPLATLIKKLFGEKIKVIFFGKTYTSSIINCCSSVDQFINYDTFSGFDKKGQSDFMKECNADAIIHVYPRNDIAIAAKNAGIPERIGTTNRIYHWLTCNRLVWLSRKNSTLHEAQLNVKLLKPIGHSGNILLREIQNLYHLKKIIELPEKISGLLAGEKFRLIIHPKSNASGREWNIDNYRDLIRFLPEKKIQIIISGGKSEEVFINEWMNYLPSHVVNLAGKLSLEELIALLNSCDGIIAASTGPLHIAAALGKFALGIYPPIRPMNPIRWAPIGEKSVYLVSQKECSDCRSVPEKCHCINDVTPNQAEQIILQWVK